MEQSQIDKIEDVLFTMANGIPLRANAAADARDLFSSMRLQFDWHQTALAIMGDALIEIMKGMYEHSGDGTEYASGVDSGLRWAGDIAERALENAGIPLK